MTRLGMGGHPGLDPRTKILFVILISVTAFAVRGRSALFALFGIGLLPNVWSGNCRPALAGGAFFLAVSGLDMLAMHAVPNLALKMGLSMLAHMTATFLPTVMLAYWAVATTDIADLVGALQRMRLPGGLVVVLAVTFRFVPTAAHEFRYIRASMKMRGVALNGQNLVRHPLRTVEYALVPLLIRSMRIAENLAASAMTRGLDAKRARSSFRDIRLRRTDFVGAALFAALLLAVRYCLD